MGAFHEWQGVGTKVGGGYEWFYFDAEHQSGAAIFISIMGPNPFDFTPFGRRADGKPGTCAICARAGSPLPQNHYGVAVGGILPPGSPVPGFEAEGYAHLAAPATEVTFSPAPWQLTLPGATVERSNGCGLPTYSVTIDVSDPDTGCHVVGQLDFEATHPEWHVPDALLFQDVNDPAHQHCWAVHVPQARVSGQLTVSAGGVEIPLPVDQWVGYHDHNWGTHRIADGFGRWIWGRGLLPDGKTVIAASIAPSLVSGAASQRVPHASVVLSRAGVESEILTLIEPLSPTPPGVTIEVPSMLAFGVSPPGDGHHVRFDTMLVVPGELPNCYQRRIAKVTLTSANGDQSEGTGVTETLMASSFP